MFAAMPISFDLRGAAAVTGRPVAEVSSQTLPPEWLGDIPHTHRAIDDARGYAQLLGVLFARSRAFQETGGRL
jgi:hypothetical protein